MVDKKVRYVAYLSPKAAAYVASKEDKIRAVGVVPNDSVIINSIIEQASDNGVNEK